MDYVFAFNAFETLLWTCIAVVLFVTAARDQKIRRRSTLAALTFLIFAGSEIMEMQTGAWWRPWWLLVWKAACVVTLIAVAVHHCRCEHASRDVHNSEE
ncbi:MAG: hypothetical protein ABGZ23_06210 [Fuerstiella sp.]